MTEHELLIKSVLKYNIEKMKPNIRMAILSNCQSENNTFDNKSRRHHVPKLAYALASICLIFVLTVNLNPAFALALSNIPVIDKIVWFTVVNKGIFNALETGDSTTVNESATDKNVSITVNEVVKGNQISLLMSVDFLTEDFEGMHSSFEIYCESTDQAGNSLNSFSTARPSYDEKNDVYLYYESLIPQEDRDLNEIKSINLNISRIIFDDGSEIDGNWKLLIPIQTNSDAEQKTWEKDLNMTIIKENGGSFVIEKIVSTTSDTAVYIKIDNDDVNNDVTMNAPRGISLLDSDGNKILMAYAAGETFGGFMRLKYYVTDLTYPNIPVKLYYNDGNTEKEIDLN